MKRDVKNNTKIISLAILSFSLMAFGIFKTTNFNSASAETKKYSGDPYDIVIRYEWDGKGSEALDSCLDNTNTNPTISSPGFRCPPNKTDEEKRVIVKEFSDKKLLITEKIAGTGTPAGDLAKVKAHLQNKTQTIFNPEIDEEIKAGENRQKCGTLCIDVYEGKKIELDETKLPEECNPTQEYVAKFTVRGGAGIITY